MKRDLIILVTLAVIVSGLLIWAQISVPTKVPSCTETLQEEGSYVEDVSFNRETSIYTIITEKDTVIVFAPYKRGAVILDRKPIK